MRSCYVPDVPGSRAWTTDPFTIDGWSAQNRYFLRGRGGFPQEREDQPPIPEISVLFDMNESVVLSRGMMRFLHHHFLYLSCCFKSIFWIGSPDRFTGCFSLKGRFLHPSGIWFRCGQRRRHSLGIYRTSPDAIVVRIIQSLMPLQFQSISWSISGHASSASLMPSLSSSWS